MCAVHVCDPMQPRSGSEQRQPIGADYYAVADFLGPGPAVKSTVIFMLNVENTSLFYPASVTLYAELTEIREIVNKNDFFHKMRRCAIQNTMYGAQQN